MTDVSDSLRIMLAIVLPWSLAYLWLRGFWGTQPGLYHRLSMLGYSLFLGLFSAAGLLMALSQAGIGFHLPVALSLLIVLGVAGGWLIPRVMAKRPLRFDEPSSSGGTHYLVSALMVLLAILISIKLVHFFLEIAWRPIFAWDAWSSWSYRARVWFENAAMVPILAPHPWLLTQDLAYTAGGHDYPALVPMLQVWMATVLGRWDDAWVNWPWWFAGLAIVFAFIGQSRLLGLSSLFAMLGAWWLISLPMVGTHIALAGYADLWAGLILLLASMSMAVWLHSGNRQQLALAVILGLLLIFIKPGSLIFAGFLLLTLALARLSAKLLLPGLLAIVLLTILALYAGDFTLHLPYLGALGLEHGQIIFNDRIFVWHPEGIPVILNYLFVYGSWHLLFWVLALALPLGMILAWKDPVARSLSLLIVLSMLFQISYSLLDPVYFEFVMLGTVFDRHLLIIAPTIVFYSMYVLARSAQRWS